MSLSRELVLAFRRMHGDRLPDHVDRRMRLHVADSVAIALAARRLPNVLAPLLEALGGGAQQVGTGVGSDVLGGREKLAPAAAAFVNASLAHALDFDDIHDPARLHATTVCFPAALAVSSLPGACSQRVVAATALGCEAMCRLGLLCSPGGTGPGSDWFLTQLFGGFGAALAAGWVLGLDDDALVSALGFAYMQSAGGKEPAFGVGSSARAIYPAFAAMGGVNAALLARAGLSGPEGSLDGTAGLLRLYLGLELPHGDRERLLDTSRWQVLDTSFKPWPCCRLSHSYIAAALGLRERLAGRAIERLVIEVNASAERLCMPLAARRRPRTLHDAKYSVPFVTAFTLVHGEPTLLNLDERALDDERVLEVASRVEIEPGLPDRPGNPPARLQAQTVDGGTVDFEVEGPPEVDEPTLQRKFLACLQFAGHADAQGLWELLRGERFDARALMQRSVIDDAAVEGRAKG